MCIRDRTNSDDVTIRNLVATGATFSGSVSIGGTLTYEDVKNVDSLGIVTARIGVKVPLVKLQLEIIFNLVTLVLQLQHYSVAHHK